LYILVYIFAAITVPPSSVIVAPFTYAPALEVKKRHVPAISGGDPIRPRGTPASMLSRNFSKVAFIIFDSKAPQAMTFDLSRADLD
jgi:hypothetical protein